MIADRAIVEALTKKLRKDAKARRELVGVVPFDSTPHALIANRIEAQADALDSLLADAQLYRWLRDVAWDDPERLADGEWSVIAAAGLDDAIREAMQNEPGTKP